eukprot:2652690-Amphidinium_carterae.1
MQTHSSTLHLIKDAPLAQEEFKCIGHLNTKPLRVQDNKYEIVQIYIDWLFHERIAAHWRMNPFRISLRSFVDWSEEPALLKSCPSVLVVIDFASGFDAQTVLKREKARLWKDPLRSCCRYKTCRF